MVKTLRNEEEWLKNYTGPTYGVYESKWLPDFLNITKKGHIFTGHCRLNYYLGNLEIPADTVCRFCGEMFKQ